MGFDGTVMDVPDSEANAAFGRSSGTCGKRAFPQIRRVSLVELGTHVEVAMTDYRDTIVVAILRPAWLQQAYAGSTILESLQNAITPTDACLKAQSVEHRAVFQA
jgi:hypothetical protein